MRVVFKVIAIIGVLSFLGGIKNGVVFIFGLVLAIVFGYLGWRPKKELKNASVQSNNKQINTIEKNQNSTLSELNKKFKLLQESFEIGLINKDEYESKSNEIHLAIKSEQEKINQSESTGIKHLEKYFKNRNRKKSYSKEELINSEPLFQNDLIWKSGLKDWLYASEIPELKEFALERPPEKKISIILRRIQAASIRSLVIYIIISVFIGIGSGLLEKNQYNNFIAQVQPNIDKYFQEERERAEQLRQFRIDQENKIKQREQNFEARDKTLERLHTEAYNKFLTATNIYDQEYYMNQANDYLDQREANYNIYMQQKELWNNNALSKNDNSIELVSYNVPRNTLSIYKNGEWYSRWNVYQGVGNHEQISYNENHRFLLRPYRAIFGVVNLSNDEIKNTSELLINFTSSALVTNLVLLPFIILLVMRHRKH